MKHNKLFLTLLLGCFLSIFMLTENKAQVFTGDVFLATQAQVDAFDNTITSITGFLVIEGSDINDLSPLSSLVIVGGILEIRNNPALQSLAGLDALTSVGGILSISNNAALTSLTGLDGLITVGGNLVIQFNNALASLSGLDALTSVGGFLFIGNNSALTEFCSLFPLLNGGFLAYFVFFNLENPTQQQIIDGGPCSPLTVFAGDDVTFLYGL
jgi:hypothetical protein